MSEYKITKESFLSDVKDHLITIVKDNGVHRHLRFGKKDSVNYSFQITTWPGYLCYTGDMGCYVFTRTSDMFRFFGSGNGKLETNPSYWSEKIEALDRRDGFKQFSPENFIDTINTILDEDDSTPEEDMAELRERVKEEVLSVAHDGPEAAYRAASEFQFNDEEYFTDFWEYDLNEFTGRYIWCCYALVWGIDLYNKVKEQYKCGSNA